jgi:hypothetical protein
MGVITPCQPLRNTKHKYRNYQSARRFCLWKLQDISSGAKAREYSRIDG